jgi:hypothetical protein
MGSGAGQSGGSAGVAGGSVQTPGLDAGAAGGAAGAAAAPDAATIPGPSDASTGADGPATSSDAAATSDVYIGTRMNLALGKPATASSVEHAGHEPERIDDGDPTTRWVGGAAVYPQWNEIDLQAAHDLDTVVIYPYMSRAYQFLLEGSLDGATYFTLSDKRDNVTGGDTIPVSFAPRSARFVRITVSGASGYTSGWTALDELEIYEAR